ncbi:MAG: portal protein, partial [Actinobacteria bacterium]|nr:portal protein [Actinomycetota bacterium]
MTGSVQHIVVIGHTDVGRRACALLESRGVRTTHLDDPSDARVREALAGPADGVAVLLHDDMRALRYSLMIEHVRPGIRLFVAMFDGTARAQLERTVPNCIVLSPAAISVP